MSLDDAQGREAARHRRRRPGSPSFEESGSEAPEAAWKGTSNGLRCPAGSGGGVEPVETREPGDASVGSREPAAVHDGQGGEEEDGGGDCRGLAGHRGRIREGVASGTT